jgi:hypothetical protein
MDHWMTRTLGTATALAALFALAQPAGASAATIASQSFTTPGEHPFVVPAGVTSLQVALVGGIGGAGKGGASGGSGGIPATLSAQLAVSPGEIMYAEVAGNGEAATGAHNPGGYGGGGEGGARSGFGGTGGGGGGGASDVRTCSASAGPSACGGSQSPNSRLIVAGGGGGGGGQGANPESSAGGNGGSADQPGSEGHKDTLGDEGGSGGQRATLVAGGAAGGPNLECNPVTGRGCATSGQLGGGGAGGSGVVAGGGGGGGGGIYGGGGGGGGGFSSSPLSNGAGGGGGGGSSGVPPGAPGVSGFSLVPTAEDAQPLVQISWTMPPPAVITGAPSAVKSTSVTLTGSVNPDGSQVSDCHFNVVPAPPSGSSVPCVQQVGAGSTPVAVSASLGGLTPSTTYAVTLVASSAQGTGSGAAVPFATATAGPGASGSLSVTHVVVSPGRFHRGRHAATISRAKPGATGTTISFQLSQAASVVMSVQRAQPGVLARHRCVAPGRAHGKPHRCTRFTTVSGGIVRGAHAGLNHVHFEGVLDGGARLAPGSYRLTVGARGSAGVAQAAQHPTFTLLP